MPEQPKSHFERFLRPVLASRFFTVSALIHLLLVLLLGGRVLFNKYVEPPDFQSTGDNTVSTDTPPAPPPPTPDTTLPPTPTLSAPPPPPTSSAAANLNTIQTLNPSSTAFSMPLPAMAPPTITKDLTAQSPQNFNPGPPVALPGVMASRTGAGRESAGEQYGEKPAAEESVMRALRWLQTQQHTDGTWGSPSVHDAFTGLALLCFLGHGETPQNSHEFSVVVSNAINALVTEGSKTAGQFGSSSNLAAGPAPYQHGICTYALCEAYTMTKDARLPPLITQAVGYIVKGQRPDGGWAYSYDTTPDGATAIKSDTSVSGWQIQALKAAHLTGLPGMESVRSVLDMAMKNMDRVFNPTDGSFGYRKAGDHNYTLTGVGVLAKLFWLGRPDRTVHEGLKNIESQDLNYAGGACSLYTWYYDTQACYQAQGAAWEWWNHRFQDQLTTKQSSDGSWPPTGGNDAGGYSKLTTGDGPLYRTVLCTLMLEVFYRYLPTTQDNALGGSSVEGL